MSRENKKLVKYADWFGTEIEESVESMIWRIRALEEENTRLHERLVALGDEFGTWHGKR